MRFFRVLLIINIVFIIPTYSNLTVDYHGYNSKRNIRELSGVVTHADLEKFKRYLIKSNSEIKLEAARISTNSSQSIMLGGQNNDNSVNHVIGKVLNYPNPFQLESGTEIGYELSQDMDITIQFYDIFGKKVTTKYISKGENGGKKGPQLVAISQSDFNNQSLPASVYFYYLINDGNVLGKGKMAILP